MPNSLFVERHADGVAFYINGDLQFDTADEAFYHEYLVIPAVALAVKRFPQTCLRVLICGGGDGLAARDVLRFPQVSHVDLVDYNPEVLELGRTAFKPYNGGSLESDRVTVYAREAFEFISAIPDNYYDVVVGDFTYPTCPEDTSIYSREWFQQVSRILTRSGIVSTNGVSPENRTTGFWCLYQTLLSSGLKTKPLQVKIPSFRRHGYGNWGFFLASGIAIDREEIEAIPLPENLHALTSDRLLQAFIFPEKIALVRHEVTIHSLDCPQLFYYLLNPTGKSPEADSVEAEVDFIDIQEAGNGRLSHRNDLELESMAQAWMEQIYQFQDKSKLVPVQHRYHSPNMTSEWLGYLKQLLSEIDVGRLLKSLLERSHELPPQIAKDLRQLYDRISSGQPMSKLPPKTAEFVMALSATLLMANIVTPDTVFAKGYYSYDDNDSGDGIGFGLFLVILGGFWLVNIFTRSDET